MSSKSYYLSMKKSWQTKQSEAQTKVNRLKTTKSSMNGHITDFDSNKADYDKKYKEIDCGSGDKAWEGQRVSDIKEKFKKEVKKEYEILEGDYDNIVTEIDRKISDYQGDVAAAIEKVSYYQGLAHSCDDDDD